MRITCTQKNLARGLSIVGHAVSNRSTLPILGNILLATDQGRLKLCATNLEIGITCWVDAEIHSEGTTTVPAKTFTELIASLPPENIIDLTVSTEPHSINVKTLKNNANVRAWDPAEFPAIPGADGSEEPVTLQAHTLKEMINQVVFAAATDESRPVLAGVHMEIKDEKLSFAAADSFRLAYREAPLSGPAELDDSIIVPAKTLAELARILPSDNTVQMIVTPNRSQVLFHTEQVDLVSRLIDGTFPNIRAAIPRNHTVRATIETKEFAAAVKAVATFARDSQNIANLTVSNGITGGSIVLQSRTEDLGDNTTTVNAAVDGDDMKIIFSTKYLSDVLAVIDTSEVVLELNSSTQPGVLRPAGNADYTYVIMPMNRVR